MTWYSKYIRALNFSEILSGASGRVWGEHILKSTLCRDFISSVLLMCSSCVSNVFSKVLSVVTSVLHLCRRRGTDSQTYSVYVRDIVNTLGRSFSKDSQKYSVYVLAMVNILGHLLLRMPLLQAPRAHCQNWASSYVYYFKHVYAHFWECRCYRHLLPSWRVVNRRKLVSLKLPVCWGVRWPGEYPYHSFGDENRTRGIRWLRTLDSFESPCSHSQKKMPCVWCVCVYTACV